MSNTQEQEIELLGEKYMIPRRGCIVGLVYETPDELGFVVQQKTSEFFNTSPLKDSITS